VSSNRFFFFGFIGNGDPCRNIALLHLVDSDLCPRIASSSSMNRHGADPFFKPIGMRLPKSSFSLRAIRDASLVASLFRAVIVLHRILLHRIKGCSKADPFCMRRALQAVFIVRAVFDTDTVFLFIGMEPIDCT